MHRLAATPGGWNPDTEGVVFIEQSPAPLVLLTAADTDIQTLAKALPLLPADFPSVRVTNLLQLQQQLTIDTYAEAVLEPAQAIVLRLLGGRAYWSYGLESVRQIVQQTGAALWVLPGDDRPDLDLSSHSTVSLSAVNQLWRYLTEGGVENTVNALKFIAETSLGRSYPLAPPQAIPRVGSYLWQGSRRAGESAKVGLLFYRAHYLAGNTAPIDALCAALSDRQLEPVPIFVSSLRDPDVQAEVLQSFQPKEGAAIDLLLNATSFSLAQLDAPNLDLWQRLDVPVFQVILSGGTIEQWRNQTKGLSPRDMAMNVALPEVDGRIITRAVSFKSVQTRSTALETDVVGYEPLDDRIQFVADLAANWIHLRRTPVGDRRIALILANYPTRDGRLANGVGLDTPQSCIEILKALQQAGYQVNDIPQTGDELIQRLTTGITNDPEGQELRSIHQSLSVADYQHYFATLPAAVQQGIGDRWTSQQLDNPTLTPDSQFPIPGIQLGNVFIGIQPSRGYDLDPTLNYHAPDLEPTPAYLAYYYWLRQHFGAQAIVHVGKHGNLEWLPGKSIALSENCYPEVALGAMPHFYPFIVNDPGEGAQAKRRAQAVILDHLTPPMTRAELYGPLQQLENLIDEYYEAQSLDPTRLPVIGDRITALVTQESLHLDLGSSGDRAALDPASLLASAPLDSLRPTDSRPTDSRLADFISRTDGYLCGLKEAQIRDGLHIFGQCPQGRQLRDLVVAIARHPEPGRLGLTRAIAQDWGWEIDPLTADPAERWSDPTDSFYTSHHTASLYTVGDAIDRLEQAAAVLVESLIQNFNGTQTQTGQATRRELNWIGDRLLPALRQTPQEITHLLHGLEGGYVPSGAAGAPTRGRSEVLPTGRNFYSVDIRAIPTESAWDVGRKAAEALIERYTQENGEYPKALALSMWGTATMRTGGDDIAEALALMGVQPIWDGSARRVVDFEILSLSALGRPRVDVTLRISGFFRDAFPNLIDLFHQAVLAVAALSEPAAQNPLAAQVQQDVQMWQQASDDAGSTSTEVLSAEVLSAEMLCDRAHYRIFGSKPGAYGAGLQGLIESQNWTDDRDLARAYINWSSYAYGGQREGQLASEAFEQRLRHLQIVLHNQDNREHDLLDSDDYYQFQGGLTAAVRALTGRNPQTYFGDHSLPENPKIRPLQEEIARVYRARVVNPKWIAGVMRHGYKGAFEMSATVDYLFAYDATAHCVEDHMYQGVAAAYLLDRTVQSFIQQKNPWALRDMAERLLEAHQRGLWQSVSEALLSELQAIALQAEAAIESHIGSNLDPSL